VVLSLKRKVRGYSPSNKWDDENWLVLSAGEACGRIIQDPDTKSWHWQLAFAERAGPLPHEGCTVDRKGAMAAFKEAWLKRPA
jgi:hypothetical protein